MKNLYRSLPLPCLAIAMLSVVPTIANADAKQDIADARHESQIWTTYTLNPYLRANNLQVAVQDGKAVLSGKVDEDINKDLAEKIALSVKGISAVDNQIAVDSNFNPQEPEGYGQVVDDLSITAAVNSRLMWSRYSYPDVSVETKSGRVSLSGNVESLDAKELAYRLATNTRGVLAVNNKLSVQGERLEKVEKAKNVAHNMGAKVADVWISAKVKSNFIYSANVDGSDIHVKTRNGLVILEGKLGSNSERTLAIELAENIKGVKSVDATELKF